MLGAFRADLVLKRSLCIGHTGRVLLMTSGYGYDQPQSVRFYLFNKVIVSGDFYFVQLTPRKRVRLEN
jgi:hypothetical protein